MGLGPAWTCLFANDISEKKARVYRANFPEHQELCVQDISEVQPGMISGRATLAWASFPCQDLSLAGNGKGLHASRSGTFWPFWSLITALEGEGRGVPIVALENVGGLLTSNQGRDFAQLLTVLVESGYRPGAMLIDAAQFVPQSRPRLFIIAVKHDLDLPEELLCRPGARSPWHTPAISQAYERLPESIKRAWVWWDVPAPVMKVGSLRDVIEPEPRGVPWHSEAETARLLSLMSPLHIAKVRAAQASGELHVGTVYKRTRVEAGVKAQRAEVRFDDVSGCLRTPVGGSSRQLVLIVDQGKVRSRLLSVREAARLMGLPDSYRLPESYNEGYHVMGDAVAVPVVAWLERHLLRPLAHATMSIAL
ncbi:DNA cytosine methyltransferase [Oscillochloris sp. ZM17-4]|nr:DNA cytosine methyltransferase [Oscillochloris sp. ZM17-4]